ncbi:MAG: phosphatidylglycerophosphatase A [Planctomycetaceae bacterium]
MKSGWQRFAKLLATGFGVGYVPLIPGTVGSLWGLPLVWVLQRLCTSQSQAPILFVSVVYSIAALLIVLASVAICHRASKEFEKHDPGQIVFDEIAVFPIVFLFVSINWTTAVIGFVWFRLFDIIKPWPLRRLEKLPGGLGIVADDLGAAIYAAAALMFTVHVKNLLH